MTKSTLPSLPATQSEPATDAPTNCAVSTGSVDAALEKAQENLMKALADYTALLPKRDEPTGKPVIEPRLMHADPRNFHLGYNMSLDSGGYMPGKIPVIVVPARPEDIKRYRTQGYSVKRLMTILLLSSPNQ